MSIRADNNERMNKQREDDYQNPEPPIFSCHCSNSTLRRDRATSVQEGEQFFKTPDVIRQSASIGGVTPSVPCTRQMCNAQV
jgi:hypothetical protein